MPKSTSLSKVDTVRFRERIQHEDMLLIERTNSFLVANGLIAVAAGMGDTFVARIPLIAFILITNVLWVCCAKQTRAVIKDLTYRYVQDVNDPVDKIVRRSLFQWPRSFTPTDMLGLYLPVVALSCWIAAIVGSLW